MNEDNIVKLFINDFKELSGGTLFFEDESDLPYCFFGDVRSILEKSIKKDKPLATKIIKWINNVLNSKNLSSYVENMLWIEFFEGAEADRGYTKFLDTNLTKKADFLFRQYTYICKHGDAIDPETKEILRFVKDNKSVGTGKYVFDIKYIKEDKISWLTRLIQVFKLEKKKLDWTEEKCKDCENNIHMSDIYDAKYCLSCDEWKESNCGDSNCEYCAKRPDKPSEAKDLQMFMD